MLGEHKGFVRVPEGLGEHHHDHRYLETSPVDAELRLRVVARIEIREQNPVERLVHDADNAENQER